MTTISDKGRTRALEMWRAALRADGVSEYALPDAITEGSARYWLAVEAHVLAAHECPTVPVWRPATRDEIQAGWEDDVVDLLARLVCDLVERRMPGTAPQQPQNRPCEASSPRPDHRGHPEPLRPAERRNGPVS